ncbi:MAG: hypothetical protein QOI95_3054 [Acidimicrobiaceae bacterium]
MGFLLGVAAWAALAAFVVLRELVAIRIRRPILQRWAENQGLRLRSARYTFRILRPYQYFRALVPFAIEVEDKTRARHHRAGVGRWLRSAWCLDRVGKNGAAAPGGCPATGALTALSALAVARQEGTNVVAWVRRTVHPTHGAKRPRQAERERL